MPAEIRITASLEDKLSKELRQLAGDTAKQLSEVNSKIAQAKTELSSLGTNKSDKAKKEALKETIKNLDIEYQHIKRNDKAEMERLTNSYKYEAKKRLEVEKTASAVAKAANKEVASKDKVIHGNYREDASRRSMSTSIVRHIRQLESLAVAYYSLTSAYNATFGAGIKLNRQYETGSLGIAAMLASRTTMTMADGTEANGYEKLKAMQTLTSGIMDDIKKAELDTPASFEQMVGFYQQAIGHAMASGKSFGSTLSEISDNTILLTKRMSNIGSSMGMSMDRINEEIRSLMSGNASSDSMIAMMLFGSPSAANDAVKEAKKHVGGLAKLFNDVMGSYDALEKEMTFDKALARLQGVIASVQKEASKPLFDDAKKSLIDLEDYVSKNKESISNSFQVMYAQAKVALTGISTLGGVVYESFVNIGGAIGLVITALSDDLPNASKSAIQSFNVFDYAILGLSTFAEGIKLVAKTFPLYIKGMGSELERMYHKTMYYANSIKDFVDPTATGSGAAYHKMQMNYSSTNSANLAKEIKNADNSAIDSIITQYNALLKARTTVRTPNKTDNSKDELIKKLLAMIKLKAGTSDGDGGSDGEDKDKPKDRSQYWKDAISDQEKDYEKFRTDRLTKTKKDIDDRFVLETKLADETQKLNMDKYDYAMMKAKEEYEHNKELKVDEVINLENLNAKLKDINDEKTEDSLKKLKEGVIELKTVWEDAFKSMEDSMVDMFMTGKFNAEDFFNTIIEGIIRMQIRNSITQPLTTAVSGVDFGSMFSSAGSSLMSWFASANGNAFIGGQPVHAFANGGAFTNSIVNKPTLAPMALFGEAGAEAIMPLTRDGSGKLGVNAQGMGGTNVVVNIENNSGTPVSQDNVSTSFDGGSMVVNIVLDAITRNKGGMRDAVRSVR